MHGKTTTAKLSNNGKRHLINWERKFATYGTERGLIILTYKELLETREQRIKKQMKISKTHENIFQWKMYKW